LRRKFLDGVFLRLAVAFLGAACMLLVTPTVARAQDPSGNNPPPPLPPEGEPPGATPAPPADAPSGKKPSEKNRDTATSNSPDQPVWDPLRAEKDLKVGRYYMNKGDVDAAIDRYEDAIVAKPGYALPFLYLGEAQEKKGQKRLAAKSYTRYLDLSPHADDADKVRKKIEKLYKELEKDKAKDK
jgi:tetratricopeptide (TPR) repeat protein